MYYTIPGWFILMFRISSLDTSLLIIFICKNSHIFHDCICKNDNKVCHMMHRWASCLPHLVFSVEFWMSILTFHIKSFIILQTLFRKNIKLSIYRKERNYLFVCQNLNFFIPTTLKLHKTLIMQITYFNFEFFFSFCHSPM